MENATYSALTRQSGLLREMQAVANNIANISTNGFRGEGVIFAEHVAALDGVEPSLSMANAEGRVISTRQGALTQTKAPFDMAIEGPGYFQVQTPQGPRLTRAGSFSPSPDGLLVTPDGYTLLDSGGSPVPSPADGSPVAMAADGTISTAQGPLAQVGIWAPTDPNGLVHEAGVLFSAEAGVEPVENGRILQGYLEQSNVNPIEEITRMIEVQRAYELGQSFLDREDARIRAVITALSR